MTQLEEENVTNAHAYLRSNTTYSDNRFSANVIIRGFGKCVDIYFISVKTNRYDSNLAFEFHIGDIGEETGGQCPTRFDTKSFPDNESVWKFENDTLSIEGQYFGQIYTAEFSPI